VPGQLSLFGSRRQRGRAPPTPREADLHFQTAEILRRWANPDWKFTHFPAGEKRDLITGARLKRMGLRRGWADFLLLSPHPPMLHQLELKRPGAALTDAQLAMQRFCVFNGYRYAVADNLDAVIATLREWGAIRVSVSA
jgi:hypothetical protein